MKRTIKEIHHDYIPLNAGPLNADSFNDDPLNDSPLNAGPLSDSPLSDVPAKENIHLAYRAWLPEDAEQRPVPAILEFLPYRKNDGTIVRDEIIMPATAEHGYACIRVDI